ncbi:hypothetical protein [Legionella donaldsonii]|uniref:hypothetical protein n=1 Tax=Legionella donaldsonii TaxID=45060 RepID=UPI00399C8F0A
MFQKREKAVDYTSVTSYAASAMSHLMLHKKEHYEQALKDLAAASANVIKKGKTVNDVVTAIENSMKASHEKSLTALNSALGMAKFQKNPTLAGYIKALETNKEKSVESLIEAVVTDTVVKANKDYGADLGDFNPAEYHIPAAVSPAP